MHCANNPVGICVVGAWIKGRGRESERHWAVLVESKRCHSFFCLRPRAVTRRESDRRMEIIDY